MKSRSTELFLLLTAVLSLTLWGQRNQPMAAAIAVFDEPILDLEADHLGHLYLVLNDRLVKTDEHGLEIARFSRPDLGIPSQVQVQDPMRVLLHYPEFNQMLLLDNRLNAIQPALSFFDLGMADVPCAALTDEHFLWLFDQASDRLIKMDMRRTQIVFRTPPITQLLQEESRILGLRCNVRGVYLLVEKGLLEFDTMGNFVRRISVGGANSFSLGRTIWWVADQEGHLRSSTKIELELPKGAAWSGTDGQLYYADGGTLYKLLFSP
jgi:hypothetical protein